MDNHIRALCTCFVFMSIKSHTRTGSLFLNEIRSVFHKELDGFTALFDAKSS